MKQKLHFLLFSFALILSSAGFSQDVRLYIAENYSTNLYVYDTTGGAYTLMETKTITGGTGVNGIYGFSLKPSTQEMYCIYSPTGSCSDRRIGILDTATAVITDIGGPNYLMEIAFYGDELFGTTNSCGGYDFVRVDQTDGSTTTLFSHAFSGYGASILYNDYTDEGLWYFSYSSGNIVDIDTTTMSESLITSGIPTQTHDMVMKNDSVALSISSWGGALYEVNLNTMVWTSVGSLMSGHAMAFNQSPFYVIVNGPNTFCENENETVLASSEGGTSYQWNLDGSPISGATDSTHVPVASGEYSVVVDGEETNPVMITVLDAPDASFDAVPNPVDLGVDATGAVDFTNTSIGGHEYHWDFGGFSSSLENPTYGFSTVGDYDVELIVVDTINGCSDTAMATITVINSTGILELSAEFRVYPVPADDVLYIDMKNMNESYFLELRTVEGKLVRSMELLNGNGMATLDMTGVKAGVYFVKIFNDEEDGTLKVIKR